jgi:hypothetical protein
MNGTHATALVCLMVVSGLPSCGGTKDTVAQDCPGPSRELAINLGCRSSEQPLVKTTGPCAHRSGADPIGSGLVYLQASGAGMCHVELTFVSGATSSIDVNIVSQPYLESDPDCGGLALVGVTDTGAACVPSACTFSLLDQTCDGAQ